MRYLLTICTDEALARREGLAVDDSGALSSESNAKMTVEYEAFMAEMSERGVLQGGERLRPSTDATTVRVRQDEILTTDGPFAETKEQVGGYFVVDCKDLDEAIEIASKIPAARHGSVEVRPIWEM
jgi:hypothetical protein